MEKYKLKNENKPHWRSNGLLFFSYNVLLLPAVFWILDPAEQSELSIALHNSSPLASCFIFILPYIPNILCYLKLPHENRTITWFPQKAFTPLSEDKALTQPTSEGIHVDTLTSVKAFQLFFYLHFSRRMLMSLLLVSLFVDLAQS